jgi:hypothetical protein
MRSGFLFAALCACGTPAPSGEPLDPVAAGSGAGGSARSPGSAVSPAPTGSAVSPAPTGSAAAPRDPSQLPWDDTYATQLAALQGDWVVRHIGSLGSLAAWHVEGDAVTIYDPEQKSETKDALEFDGPCKLRVRERGDRATFVSHGGMLNLGLGGGGTKIGDRLIACIDHWREREAPPSSASADEDPFTPDLVVVERGSCRAYAKQGAWRSTSCLVTSGAPVDEAGPNELTVSTGHYQGSLPFIDATTLMTEQLRGSVPERLPDWTAAKARADAVLAARAPAR